MKQFITKHSKLIFLLFCLLISFLCLSICSKNSYLYPFNNWPDENVFFTVGKAWTKGLIPYKDLFEQKGPFLFLIFALGSIITPHSFLSIFIFEVISLTICLYFTTKIISLFLPTKYSYLILPVFTSILVSSTYFVHGGSAEEFCFPLITYTTYTLLKYFTKENQITNRSLFLNGFIAGLIFMIKFNLLGFWFAFMCFTFIYLLTRKEIKKAFISCFIFVAGMIIPFATFSIYFLLVGGFKDFIDTYFIFNITGYTNTMGLSTRIRWLIDTIYSKISSNFWLFNLLDVGLLYFFFSKKLIKNFQGRLALIMEIALGTIGIFCGGQDFTYYFLPVMYFTIFGFIAFFSYFDNIIAYPKLKLFIVIILILGLSLRSLSKSNNLSYMSNSKDNLVQYRFAELINQEENSTLLNYHFLDSGFYFASDILPTTKYFHQLNAIIPNMEKTLTNDINNKKYDFIVTRSYKGYDPTTEALLENYTLISTQKETFEGTKFTYYLYHKK